MAFFFDELIVAMPGLVAVLVEMGVGVDLTVEVAVGEIETKSARADVGTQAEMPFPDHGRDVASHLQETGDRQRVGGQRLRALVGDRGVDVESARVAARKDSRTGRRAGGVNVMPLEANAIPGEFVEVGRLDLGVVVADVAPAEVVRNDDDDIGRRFRLLAGVAEAGEHSEGGEDQQGRQAGEGWHGRIPFFR